MSEEIKEGNKLIAEFVGYNDNEYPNLLPPFDWCGKLEPKDMKYHSSWDWLMAVVEKIESLGYEFTIFNKTTHLNCGKTFDLGYIISDTKREAVYKTVVEFIKWYNKPTQP